jgi:hypothetical protein
LGEPIPIQIVCGRIFRIVVVSVDIFLSTAGAEINTVLCGSIACFCRWFRSAIRTLGEGPIKRCLCFGCVLQRCVSMSGPYTRSTYGACLQQAIITSGTPSVVNACMCLYHLL